MRDVSKQENQNKAAERGFGDGSTAELKRAVDETSLRTLAIPSVSAELAQRK